MYHFLNKFWKKLALALLAFFWAGCDDESNTTEAPLYGCPIEVCGNEKPDTTLLGEYGSPIPCYSTTIQNDAGETLDIFECSNGEKYLNDPANFDERIKNGLPEGVKTTPLVKSTIQATNCTESHICADGVNAEGNPVRTCYTSLECPSKE